MRERASRFMPTAFDLRALGRSLGASMAVAILSFAVLASTDADHPSWWGRVARLAAMSPVFGLIGTGLGLAQSKARGEWLALASIGVHPLRASAGVLAGAWIVAAAGAFVASLPATDLSALFPAVPQMDWVRDGAVWTSLSSGVRLGPGRDDVGWVTAVAAGNPIGSLRVWVVATILVSGAVTPAWLLVSCGRRERMLVAFAAVAAQLWAFHAVASARSLGWILLSGSVVLAVHALTRALPGMLARVPGRSPEEGRATQIP